MLRKTARGMLIPLLLCAVAHAQAGKGVTFVPSEEVRTERARRWAVLIGVDKYDETGIGSLKYCSADMKLLYRVLTGPTGGFEPENVLLMTHDAARPGHRPTYANMVMMLLLYLHRAQAGDDLLIVFSGHGLEERGNAYLLPGDAVRTNLSRTALPVSLVREWLEACPAGRKILVVDAFHAAAGQDVPAMSQAFWNDVDSGKGFMRFASCGPKQKSREDENLLSPVGRGHGVFTYYLAEGLEGKGDYDRDGRVDIDEAYRYACAATRVWAWQNAIAQSPIRSGSMTGVMTIGYHRDMNQLQRDRQSAEARIAELKRRSEAGDDTARKAMEKALRKEAEALQKLKAKLRELESGEVRGSDAVMQYRVASEQVASLEKELAQRKRLHTAAGPAWSALQRKLLAARAEQERLAGASMKLLRARGEALRRRQAEMRKEMAPTHPKTKQMAATSRRAENDLAAMVGEARVRQYQVACKQVASIERKLVQKKELHTDTSPVVKTLQKELSAARAEQERHRTTAMKSMVAALQALTRRQADIRKALRKEMPKEMRLTDPKMKEARAATSAGEGAPAPAVGEAAIKQYEVASAQVATIERELAQKIKLHADTSPVVTTLQKELSSARAEQEVHRKAVTEWMVAVLQALMLQQAGMRKGMQSTPPKVKQMDAAIQRAAQNLAALLGDLPEMTIRQILAALIDGVPLTIALELSGGATMDLVYIPAGKFMMGSPADEEGRAPREGPQHRVRITRPFYMGATEVTQAQYEAVMGKNPSQFKGASNPVGQVLWNDCVEFCKRLSQRTGRTLRLPTEAEWEYACRAGTRTPFFFGETISTDQANYDGDYTYGKGKKGVDRKKIVPVGSFPPNGFGLYDMHGNVWEWCADWYDEDYYKQSPTDDPQGPRRGKRRVLRGGSWFNGPRYCRSAGRSRDGPSLAGRLNGFRVVARAGQEFN